MRPLKQPSAQSSNLSWHLWRHKESFVWSEYARLYEKNQKETQNNMVETTLNKTNFFFPVVECQCRVEVLFQLDWNCITWNACTSTNYSNTLLPGKMIPGQTWSEWESLLAMTTIEFLMAIHIMNGLDKICVVMGHKYRGLAKVISQNHWLTSYLAVSYFNLFN